MKKIIDKYVKKLKHHFYEVLQTKTSSHSIALGFALGTFISLLPIPGIDIFIGLFVVAIFKSVNKYSMVASVMIVWNPILVAPFYLLSYKIGDWIFGAAQIVDYDLTFLDHVYNFTRRFLIGNLMISIIVSIISYYLVKKFVTYYRNKEGDTQNEN